MEVVLKQIITYLPIFALLLITISGLDPICKIIRRKSIKNISCFPFLAIFTNCSIWTRYGLLIQDIIVTSSNTFGAASGFLYIAIYFYFADSSRTRLWIIKCFASSLVILGVVAVGIPFLFPDHLATVRLFVGICGDTTSVIMRASPLIVIKKVITYKSTKHLSFFMAFAMTFHGFSWIIYSWFIFPVPDIFILIPNVLGFLAGGTQLLLFAVYWRTSWDQKLLGDPKRRIMATDYLGTINEHRRDRSDDVDDALRGAAEPE